MFQQSLSRIASARRAGGGHSFPLLAGRAAIGGVFLAVGVAAAPLATLAETITLGSDKVTVERASKYHSAPARSPGARAARGIFSIPIACPVVRFGLRDPYWEEAEEDDLDREPFRWPVGYSNTAGGGRPRCREGISRSYVTRVRFPVGLIPEEWEIVSATLRYTEARRFAFDEPHLDCPSRSPATHIVEMNWVSFREGPFREVRRNVDEHRLWQVHSARAVTNYADTGGKVVEVDVSPWMALWHNGFDNRGISIYGGDHSLKKNNKACMADIGQDRIRLVIEWER